MSAIIQLLSSENPATRAVVWGSAAAGIALMVGWAYHQRKSRSFLTPDAQANTVILHQPPRGPYAPNLVPFALKLETYLRVAKIPYKVVSGFTKSPKGKVPWLEYNGEVVSDSAFCMSYLNDKLGVDLTTGLTDRDLAVGKALQRMVEEHLYWCYVAFPWVLEPQLNIVPKLFNINRVIVWMIQHEMKKRIMVQGVGRHTKGEITHAMEEDFQALSHVLGDKKFFFGDKATDADCAIFGQLAEFRWNMPGHTPARILCEKYPNLCEFCDRMKTTF